MKSSAILWSPFVVAQKAGANSNCQPGCMPASTFESLCSNQLFWMLLLHVECVYICLFKFLYVMSFDFRMPGCLTRCGDTLWEKSESHGDPKPERKGDLAASEVWIFLVQMFSKKCEIGNAWKIGKRLKQMHVLSCCVVFFMDMALTANEQNNLTIVSIEWNAHTAHCLLLHRVEVHYLDGLSATLFGMACSDKVSVPACMRRAAFTSEKPQSHIYEPLIAVSTAKSCNNCQLNVKHLIFA